MNKSIKIILLTAVIIGAFAFINSKKEKVVIKESSITWMGQKVIGSSHTGTLTLKEGYFLIEEDLFVGGNFVIDMTSLTATNMDNDEYRLKLENHLKSDDFFNVEKFPTASLAINRVGQLSEVRHYEVHGTITIKGISNPITFNISSEDRTATVHLEIDRSKFDVRYGSDSFFDNLGDRAISDIFEVDITMKY